MSKSEESSKDSYLEHYSKTASRQCATVGEQPERIERFALCPVLDSLPIRRCSEDAEFLCDLSQD